MDSTVFVPLQMHMFHLPSLEYMDAVHLKNNYAIPKDRCTLWCSQCHHWWLEHQYCKFRWKLQ